MTDLLGPFINKANPTGAEPVPNNALFNETQDLQVVVQPGKTYLFRMVNMGAFAGQYVWFEGHNITIVEVDGIYTQPAVAEMIYLGAAQRCSFLLTTKNETNSNYAFIGSMDTVRSLPYRPANPLCLCQYPVSVRYPSGRLELERHRMARI
jgi:iron transport multicopper oxidase